MTAAFRRNTTGDWVTVPEVEWDRLQAIAKSKTSAGPVYAVVFANYEPTEVDSLWWQRADAQAQVDFLNAGSDWKAWRVAEMAVHITRLAP